MRGSTRWAPSLAIALLLAPGCSAITGFGGYHPNDGSGDAGMDANVPDPDGGDEDGGPRDGGGEPDGGGDPCDPACGTDEVCCDGECRASNTLTDCGGCDVACPARANATARCAATGCTFDCNTGFEDCDGDASTGCEASLSSTSDCGGCDVECASGEVCALVGGVRECATSCPGSSVDCGGTCFTPGGACFCTSGAAAGTESCVGGSVQCAYPAEACNAVDDDCDGSVNEGFDCSSGMTRSCASSCGTAGTESCVDATCTWSGTCVVVERCDRTDTDCDMLVDESVISVGSPFIGSGNTANPRAAVNAPGNELGVVHGGAGLTFVRTSFDGVLVSGSSVTLTTTDPSSWDIAFDGSDYVVAWVDRATARIEIRRVGATGTLGGSTFIERSFANTPLMVRLDRIGTTSRVAVLHTTEQFGTRAEAVVTTLSIPSGITSSPTELSNVALDSSGGGGGRWFRAPAIARTATDAVVAYTETMSSSGEIRLALLRPDGTIGPMGNLAPDTLDEVMTELAFDPISGLVGVSYIKQTASGGLQDAYLASVEPSGFGLRFEQRVDTGTANALTVATAADGNFGVLVQLSSGTTRLHRVRATDGVAVPAPITPSSAFADYLQGVPTSGTRYVAFRGRSMPFATVPYGCAP